MTFGMTKRMVFACSIVITIIIGILSRLFQTQNIVFDKYLGDMLYAALVYLLISFVWTGAAPLTKLLLAMIIMILIESFRLTGIPLSFRRSESVTLQILAFALGTGFSFLDIIAYLAGIVLVYLVDSQFVTRRRS
jgi:hypothetical protein